MLQEIPHLLFFNLFRKSAGSPSDCCSLSVMGDAELDVLWGVSQKFGNSSLQTLLVANALVKCEKRLRDAHSGGCYKMTDNS